MWIFGRKGESGFGASSTAEDVTKGIDGTGLTAIVTGASSGIGTETARVLAIHGVHVVMGVRNTEAGRTVKETILMETPDAIVDVIELDLSSLASVREFAAEYCSLGLPLNILINNAGVMAPPFTLSKDKIELQFATNHLGWKKCYSPIYAYGQSKLANILHANELSRQFKVEKVELTANSLHPGGIATSLLRHHSFLEGVVDWVGKYFLKTIPQGAATTCYVALHPQVKGVSGEYFVDSNKAKPSSLAKDSEFAKKLWDFSLGMVAP